MIAKVHIKKEPFLEMLSAATETFRRECLGWAFGLKPTAKKKHYVITHIHHITRTRIQKNLQVDSHTRSDRRLKKLFADSPRLYNRLARFHSHNEYGKALASPSMSGDDIATSETDIEIIIVMSARKKSAIPWQVDPDGSILGSLNGYNFHFNAYTVIDSEGKRTPRKLQIVAPLALRALNRAQKRIAGKKNKK